MSDDTEHNGAEDDPLQSIIGQQLRSLYDEVLAEPIPDNIVELLAKLETIELPSAEGSSDDAADR